ncbi:helix-turn-helix domain-containing protein [Candidatus Regiella endosymbiont of Tuberolachnus salignus]|uniref:helix-turn-helix domain-containing protein n=1 Tax=Candidatus Regiella endosymbiont of Tuberolachnus salignus TaxID=3077956 RepID=UPI0030D1D81D
MNRLQEKLPTQKEAALAKLCSLELSAGLETKAESQTMSLTDRKGGIHTMTMPVNALRLFVDMLTKLGEGNTVKLVPVSAELTTQEAADLISVSRPTLIKLLDEGEIPYRRVGNRRKVKFSDLRVWQQQIENKRLKALSELSSLDQALGLGYE